MTGVAVVGLGYWGPNLVRNFNALGEGALVAVCDRDAERLGRIKRDYPGIKALSDFEDVLSDPGIHAVAIATPVATHFPLARAALEAGKHVLVEKPLTVDPAHAEELTRLAREKKLVLMVDHVFLYSPAVRMMKDLIESGELGELLFIDSVRINLGLFQHDVNVLWDLAPHDLSIVDYLVGREPRSVSAFGASHTPRGFEDVAYLNLDFGDNLIANFHVNWLSPVKIRYTMIGGSKKSLIYNDLDPVEKVKVYDSGITVREGDVEGLRNVLIDYRTGDIHSPRLGQAEPLRNVASHFVECIEQGKTPLSDGEGGLRVVKILDAAQKSIEQGGVRIDIA